jgi:hypothetical protein
MPHSTVPLHCTHFSASFYCPYPLSDSRFSLLFLTSLPHTPNNPLVINFNPDIIERGKKRRKGRKEDSFNFFFFFYLEEKDVGFDFLFIFTSDFWFFFFF